MSAAVGLLTRCRNAMTPEPIIIVPDAEGNPQLPSLWELPARTVIDPHNLFYRGWVVIEAPFVKLVIGEKTIVYERIGYDLHGAWICDLRRKPNPDALPE
jgi:hypothetical protein